MDLCPLNRKSDTPHHSRDQGRILEGPVWRQEGAGKAVGDGSQDCRLLVEGRQRHRYGRVYDGLEVKGSECMQRDEKEPDMTVDGASDSLVFIRVSSCMQFDCHFITSIRSIFPVHDICSTPRVERGLTLPRLYTHWSI
jgi:hypothetical protein